MQAYVEDHVTELDGLEELMKRHTVSVQGVMNECLRNGCRSVVAIKWAARYLESFNVEEFVTELVESILNQPYRGLMLR